MNLNSKLVGVVVMFQYVGADLAAVVREEDTLTGFQANPSQPTKSGPNELSVTVLAGHFATIKPHRVTSVWSQIDTVVVFRKWCWRFYGLDHARVIESIITESRNASPYDRALS